MSCVVEHDRLRRGRKTVLQPSRLEFPDGAVVGVIGANGAGKSTLFFALAGLLRRGAGSALVTITHGRDDAQRKGSRPSRSVAAPTDADAAPVQVAFMPQDSALPPWLTAGDAIALFAEAPDEELYRALSLGHLLSVRVGRMSGGERQAVALAAALGPSADVLVLDEPFAHLDFTRRIAAIELLRERARGRALTLISSQNAADLVTLCNWYLVLRDGRAVFNGCFAELVTEDTAAEDRLPAVEKRLVALLDGSAASVTASG